jgi:predicted dehydrogenase
MTDSNRRSFLEHTAAASAGAAAWAWTGGINAAGANERLTVGVIGCGGRGAGLAEEFAGLADVSYVCDPDASRCRRAQEKVRAKHAVADLRRILDDKSVDAVVIATPEHWHAPAAILACDAGKHVYVEKPCSHNVREGRLLVEAARRNKRVVQHGTQSRSNPFIAGAIQMLREGVIGDVLVAKAWDIQRRVNIGRGTPSDPPPGVDYDLWVGPAEFVPFQANRFHYHWHWWYNFGVGGLGADGPHEIDYARWGLGVETHPSTVAGLGSKYYFDDDQEYPDTGTVVFEWPGDGQVGHKRQFIFELRIWSTNYPYNVDSGAEFYGTRGKMFLSKRGKLEILDDRNKPITAKPKDPPQLLGHAADFLDAINTGRQPNAEIEIGHLSTTLVHLGNLAMRVGRSLNFDPRTERIIGDDDANQLLGRRYRKEGHWAIPKGVQG